MLISLIAFLDFQIELKICIVLLILPSESRAIAVNYDMQQSLHFIRYTWRDFASKPQKICHGEKHFK